MDPTEKCFGCGPTNEKGLRIKSFVEGDYVVATFTPEPHHEAWEGVINGGIVGCLFDCHSNWTAAYHLMSTARGLERLAAHRDRRLSRQAQAADAVEGPGY